MLLVFLFLLTFSRGKLNPDKIIIFNGALLYSTPTTVLKLVALFKEHVLLAEHLFDFPYILPNF